MIDTPRDEDTVQYVRSSLLNPARVVRLYGDKAGLDEHDGSEVSAHMHHALVRIRSPEHSVCETAFTVDCRCVVQHALSLHLSTRALN